MLTGVQVSRGSRAEGVTAASGGEARRSAMTGLLEWSSSLLILLVRLLVVLWKGYGGQGAPELPAARNQGGGRVTCSGGSGEILGELRTGVEGCGLGNILGHGAELLRGSCEAGARRSVVVAAAQGTLRGGAARA